MSENEADRHRDRSSWERGLSHAEATDATLIRRAQGGDRAAFGELVSRYMRRAYFGALGLLGSHDDALDVSQEAFIRAFRARRSIDPERPFFPWLYQILRRLCFNVGRDRGTRRRLLEQASPWLASVASGAGAVDPSRAAEQSELRDRVAAAIQGLPAGQREIIVLREFDGLSYGEIAEVTGIPLGTVMSRLHTARRSLAAKLGDEI
jgi:RNA polymerase sigma-70 factor (ECF subfamily)